MNKYFSVFMFIALMFFSASIFASDGQPNGQSSQKSQVTIEKALQTWTMNSVKNVDVQLNTEQNVNEFEFPKTEGVLCRMAVHGFDANGNYFSIKGSCRKVRKMLQYIKM